MNILSFDIEEWYLEKAYFGAKETKYAEYDKLLDEILSKLEELKIKGTFFCVGKMATVFPTVVRKIAEAGHEIGCHSNSHQWLNKMTYNQAMEDTRIAVDCLEQCTGVKIISYRAPAFSIGKDNAWAFEVLAANGIECDASVFPASRDFGGFPEFKETLPTIIEINGIRIKEFPICTASIFGKDVAYSGGGYFRFFPLRFVKNEMLKSVYSMTYFHLSDLLPIVEKVMSKEEYERYFNEPGTTKARYIHYLKSQIGVKQNKRKLFDLIETIKFDNLIKAKEKINWDNVPQISL